MNDFYTGHFSNIDDHLLIYKPLFFLFKEIKKTCKFIKFAKIIIQNI